MLRAFNLADQLTGEKCSSMESLMQNVAENYSYYKPGHGVLYEARPSWFPVYMGSVREDWVTTEAMGLELEAF